MLPSTSPNSNSQVIAPKCSVITLSLSWPWSWLRDFTSTSKQPQADTHFMLTHLLQHHAPDRGQTTAIWTASQSRRRGPGVSSLGARGPGSTEAPTFQELLVTWTQEGGPADFKGYFSSNFCPSSWFWNLIPTLRGRSIILRLNTVHFETWMSVHILLYLKNIRETKG